MMGMASGPLTTSLVTIYLLLCLLALGFMVVVAVVVAAAVWRSRARATGRAALAAVGCVLGWLLAVILALVSPTASLAIFWHQTARFVFVVLSTPLLICFIAAYFGTPRLSRWLLLSLFVVPGLTILLDLTNSLHHLFLASYAMLRVGPYFVRSAWVPGPWFPVYAVFSSASLTMTVVAVVLAFRRRPPLYRAQVRLFVLSLLPPSALLLFDTLSRAPLATLGTAPLGFAAMALLQVWVLLHQRLFDLVPVAREAMFVSMDDPVLALDRHGRIVDLNPAAEQALGLPADQVLGAELERLLPVSLGDLQAATDAASDANGRVNAVNETNVQTPHGFPLTLGSGERRSATRFYDVQVSPLVLSPGHVDGQLLVLRDVTALKQAQAHVAEQTSQLEAIFEAQADGVGVFDRQRRLVRANRAWQAILQQYADISGLSADPAFAVLPLADQVNHLVLRDEHGHVIPREQRPTSRALRGETITGASAVDEWVHSPTGQAVVVFSVSAAPMRDPTGQIMGAVTIVRDVTERRQLAARLAEQERQFRTLVEHSPDIITRFDPMLRHLYVSPRAEAALGIPAAQRVGKTFAELGLPEALYAPWERAIREVFASGEPRDVDLTSPYGGGAADAQTYHYRGRYVPEFGLDGTVATVLGITTDITELRQTETRLAEQASQLEAIFEAQMDAIAVYDLQGRFVRANTALRQLFGLAADTEYTARPLVERAERLRHFDEHGQLLSAEQWPLWRVLNGEIFAGGSAMDVQVRALDGREVWTSITGAPIRTRDGQVTGGVLVTRDVTARRQLERRVAEQERQFRTLVEHSPDIIARFDRNLRYLYVNPAIGAVSPLPPDAYIGKTNAELGWPEPQYRSAHRAIAQVFATGQSCTLDVPGAEFTADSPDAPIFLARFVPEFGPGDADGAVASVLTITTEITDRKRAEVALREAKVAAERAHQVEEHRRQEAERREAIAASLRDVLRILNSKRPLQEVLHVIAEHAGRLLGSAATAIYGTADGLAAGLAENTAEGTVMPTVGGVATEDLAAWQRCTTSQQRLPGATSGLDAPGGLEEPATGATADMFERLTLLAAAGLPLLSWADQTQLGLPTRLPRLPLAHAAVRHAMATRSPVVVLNGCGIPADRGGAESTLPMQFEALPSPFHALLVVPIAVHEEVYGCLLLFYTMRWQFAAEDVALASAYADQIALAIANARLQTHIAQAATEAERARLAGDLHDTVTQELFSASLLAQALPQLWDQHRAEAEAALGQLHAITQSGLATLRLLLLELRPGGLEEMPLPALVRQLLEAMRTRAGVPLGMETAGTEDGEDGEDGEGDWMSLPQEVKQAFYRMAQEAITNAVKYAAASRIVVRLRREQRRGGALRMEIEDDGVGFDPHLSTPGHFGLAMMRERAQMVGASVHIESQLGQGTRVVVRWRPHREGYKGSWEASAASASSAAVAVEQEKGDAHD